MKSVVLVVLVTAMSARPAGAELPLAKAQLFGEHTQFSRSPIIVVNEGGQVHTTQDRAKDQDAWGLRVSVRPDQESDWNLELAMRTKKRSFFSYVGPITPTINGDYTRDSLAYSWWGPGASYDLELSPVVSLNFGLDFRIERVTYFLPEGVIVPEGYSESSVFTRPWARASLAFNLPHASTQIRPYIGFEGAVALTHKKVDVNPNTQHLAPEDMRRGFAPNVSVAVFAGVSF
jgi:hypothetical protein